MAITDFLKTSRSPADLRTALDVLLEFKSGEDADEFSEIPFSAWAKLEQLQEFLEHLVEGKPLKQDTVYYIESLRAEDRASQVAAAGGRVALPVGGLTQEEMELIAASQPARVMNLADPDFEPTDEQLANLMRGFAATVRARGRQRWTGNHPMLSMPKRRRLLWARSLVASDRPWNARRRPVRWGSFDCRGRRRSVQSTGPRN